MLPDVICTSCNEIQNVDICRHNDLTNPEIVDEVGISEGNGQSKELEQPVYAPL